jgi:hypothetical protein
MPEAGNFALCVRQFSKSPESSHSFLFRFFPSLAYGLWETSDYNEVIKI